MGTTTCTKTAGIQLSGLVQESLGTARIPFAVAVVEIECYRQSRAKEDIECVLHVCMVQFTVE